MIGEPIALQIQKEIQRPALEFIDRFKNTPTTFTPKHCNNSTPKPSWRQTR